MFGPAAAYKPGSNPLVRGLTGDVRPAMVGGMSAQLIDAEWQTPGAFLVTGLFQTVGGTWTLRTGLDRAILVQGLTGVNDQFSQIVIARSISLTFVATQGTGPGYVQAVAIPIELSYDLIDLLNGQSSVNGLGAVNPLTPGFTAIGGVAVSTVSVQLATAGLSGVTVYNFSPAGRTLYLAVGDGPADISNGAYTIPIAPGGYWESPDFAAGQAVYGIWDGADVSGYANVTRIV